MADKNSYIDISELQPTTWTRKYPWDEWAKLPPGKALDITDLVSEAVISSGGTGIRGTAASRGLKIMAQKKRIYVYRPRES